MSLTDSQVWKNLFGTHECRLPPTLILLVFYCSLWSCPESLDPCSRVTQTICLKTIPPIKWAQSRQQHNPSGPSAGQYVAPHRKNKKLAMDQDQEDSKEARGIAGSAGSRINLGGFAAVLEVKMEKYHACPEKHQLVRLV